MTSPPGTLVHDQAIHESGDMAYDAITAMLGSDDQLDNSLADELHPAALQHHPSDTSSAHAKTSGVMSEGSAFTQHAKISGSHSETSALDLPSVPASSASPARLNTTQTAYGETEEDLLARFTALIASTAAPAETLNTLTDRLAALKGPKVTAAELQDLQSRFEDLKGSKNTVPLSELEGRLAKLKGISPAPCGQLSQLKSRSERQLIPDFDPGVELNQEQLQALASVGDSLAKDNLFEKCLSESTSRQQQPPMKLTPANITAASATNLQQVLQEFDPEDENCISEQQLRALASMPTGVADTSQFSEGVPQWAAALGLSAQTLQYDSECSQSDSGESSDIDGSCDYHDAFQQGKQCLASSAAWQARLVKLTRQKLLHKRRT